MELATPVAISPERTALKEWAVLVDALVRGDICAMIRKGGIREQRAGFSVRHDQFLLYPTYFHEKESELAERLRGGLEKSHAARPPEGTIVISHVARVAAVWRVTALEPLREIESEHGLAWDAVESRFFYRNSPGVHVIAPVVSALPRSITLPETRRYLGCVSWVELDQAVDVSAARPLQHPEELRRRVELLRLKLGEPMREEVQA